MRSNSLNSIDCKHHMRNHCGTTIGEVVSIHLATLASGLVTKIFLSLVSCPIVHMPTFRQQILFVLLDVCWRNFSQRKNTAPNPWTLSNGNCVFCLLWHIVAMCYLVIYLGPVPRHSHFREQVERPYQTDTHFVTFLKSTLFQSFISKFIWCFV